MLTNTQIRSRLQIANACGAKKINTYIENLKNGKYCPELLAEANILFGYIDSLKCYKIYDDSAVVSSTTTLNFNNLGWTNKTDEDFYFSIGDCILAQDNFSADYLTFIATMEAIFDSIGIEYVMEQEIDAGDYYNNFTFTLPCFYTTSPVTKLGVLYATDATGKILKTGNLGGGVCNYPYEDCITYENVLNILSAISKICDGNCTDYLTFES